MMSPQEIRNQRRAQQAAWAALTDAERDAQRGSRSAVVTAFTTPATHPVARPAVRTRRERCWSCGEAVVGRECEGCGQTDSAGTYYN